MTIQEKFTITKLIFILNNLDSFTKSQVINETDFIVDEFAFNGEYEPSVEKLHGMRTLAMAINKIKCSDC